MDGITNAGCFNNDEPAFCNIYRKIAAPINENRIFQQKNTSIGVTENYVNENEAAVIISNYNPKNADTELKLKAGRKISKSLYGEIPNSNKIKVNANDALVLMCKRKTSSKFK